LPHYLRWASTATFLSSATFLKGGKMAGERQPLQLPDNLLFPKIFQAFHMAVQPGTLGVALLGVAIICLAGHIMDFSRTVVVRSGKQNKVSELQVYMDSAASDAAVLEFRREFAEEGMRAGVFATLWRFGA
jgi:hypothetical protein